MTTMNETTRIDEILESLCNLFDDELERQQISLALCRAQGEGLRVRDLSYVDAKTAALEVLIREAAQAERKRNELLREVMTRWGIHSVPPTLTTLIQAAPETCRKRLIEFQTRMRQVIAETRMVVRSNATLLRVATNAVEDALRAFEMAANRSARVYTSRGNTANAVSPALIDHKG